MSPSAYTRLSVALLAIGTFVLYGSYLGSSPGALNQHEMSLASAAHMIASTGHDFEGRHLPLYFHVSGAVWFQPVPVYLAALLVRLAPVSETAVRWPTVIVGAIDVVLMYFITIRLLRRKSLAVVGSCLLLLMPAHFIHSRLAMDYLFPVPFVMAWFLCLLGYVERPTATRLFAATMFLGIAFYTHSSELIMTPVYLMVTCVALLLERTGSIRTCLVAAAGLGAPMLLLLPWFFVHPDTYLDTVGRWAVHPAHLRNPLAGLSAVFNWRVLSNQVWLYWDFLSPGRLFFGRDAATVSSTRWVGMFLSPMALLVPLGIYHIAQSWPSTRGLLLLLAAACSPLGAATFNEQYAIGHELVLLPFVVAIATFGVDYLFSTSRMHWRIAAGALLVLMLFRFYSFDRDYFRTYRTDILEQAYARSQWE